MSEHFLITTNVNKYAAWKGAYKILFQNDLIVDCILPGSPDQGKLNGIQAGVEFEAAEEFITYISAHTPEIVLPSQYIPEALRERSDDYATYGFLYLALKERLFKCFLLKYQLKAILKTLTLPKVKTVLDLCSLYHHFPANFYLPDAVFNEVGVFPVKNTFRLPGFKNWLYRTFGKMLHPSIPQKDTLKKRILFFTHSPFYTDRLMHSFYKQITRNPTIELIIIYCKTGIGGKKTTDAALFKKKGIGFYEYESFKTGIYPKTPEINEYLKNSKPELFTEGMERYFYATELNYGWMETILRTFKPHLVMTTSLGETGRYMADVADLLSIPSVYLEYSLFTDDAYWMNHGVKFDHKFCIGQESIDLWKRRKDPSTHHHLLGYLKFDEAEKTSDPRSLLKRKCKFTHDKTIFFASTWSGTNAGFNKEKAALVHNLIEKSAGLYNLIIKKHPSENDTLIDDLASKAGENVYLMSQYSDELLLPMIEASDLICTQNSGIGLEALYYKKPFCYLSFSENKIAEYSLLQKSGYSRSYHDINEFFNAVPGLLEESKRKEYSSERLLFRPAEMVSERMLNLLYSILKIDPKANG